MGAPIKTDLNEYVNEVAEEVVITEEAAIVDTNDPETDYDLMNPPTEETEEEEV